MTYNARLHPEAPELDALSAYDHSGIGREFLAVAPSLTQHREHEERRSQLLVDSFKSGLADSQRVPKASLRRLATYDNYCAASQSVLTIAIYVIAACFAGAMLAFIIKNLAF
jgi:hypothetical protein